MSLRLVQQIIVMKQSLWRGKKNIKRWEMERQLDGHLERLRQVRPTSCDPEWLPPTLNQNKKLMLQEDKYTEIQRQNRYLLEKITTTMNKRTERQKQKDTMSRSLHASFRKKQMETIEVQNLRLLKRIKQKKSDYDSQKLKEEWKKQKEVIKNIAFYPFILRTSFKVSRKRTFSKPQSSYTTATRIYQEQKTGSSLGAQIEMVRIRKIDDENFVITIKMNQQRLLIVGDQKKNVQKKIITVPREEALAFIEGECEGKIEGIFDRLSFDAQEDVLYLVGNGGDHKLTTIREKVSVLEDDKPSNI